MPAGTQSRTCFRIREKGVASLRTKRRGDLLATVWVEVPKALTAEQKAKLEAFAEAMQPAP